MTDQDSRRPPGAFHTVAIAEQARLLSDPKSLRFFTPFLASEKTVSGAARELTCELHTMLYRVRTFLKAGLLRVTREQKRMGRPVKIYRSVHDAYFIPFSATPYADLEERLREQLGPLTEELVRGFAGVIRQIGYDGRRLYRDAGGLVNSEAGEETRFGLDYDNPAWPVVYDFRCELYLPREEAKVLQRELRDLYARYLPRRQVSPVEKYVLQVALVPQPDN